MPQVRRGAPDVLSELAEAMREDGYSHAQVRAFTEHWKKLPAQPQVLPCPFCFSDDGVEGDLVAMPADRYGKEYMRCRECGEDILVRQRVR